MKKKECPSCAMEIDAKSEVCPVCRYEFPSVKSNTWTKWIAILLLILFLLYMVF